MGEVTGTSGFILGNLINTILKVFELAQEFIFMNVLIQMKQLLEFETHFSFTHRFDCNTCLPLNLRMFIILTQRYGIV